MKAEAGCSHRVIPAEERQGWLVTTSLQSQPGADSPSDPRGANPADTF